MSKMSAIEFEDFSEEKIVLLKEFLEAQPPHQMGEQLVEIWSRLFCKKIKSVVVDTIEGASDDVENPVFPYEKLEAVVGDGHNWKWPRMWQHLDEIERRGDAYRAGEAFNFGMKNKFPNVAPMRVCVVGGGPVGTRMAIELAMGGHKVTQIEKRRELRNKKGDLEQLGFTNRINRPHMWAFVRNDLAKLNGKDFLQQKAQYPVFTEPDTSSIGIDELQCLLLKNAFLLGVDFRLGVGYVDASVSHDKDSMMPTWQLKLKYDKEAADAYGGKVGVNIEEYDMLVGCDGPRSTVRDTMTKYLGDIEKRKFMDCVGIVANVRKVSRARLRQLGFEYGQEPSDMNRTKMIFKDFFKKIEDEAGADLEAMIYYKASFHNYTILTPKRANLIKNGLSGKVYHHTVARAALDGDPKIEEKKKLKNYCLKVIRAAGIPVDDQLPNGGFVDAPNDVMAFDFAECWNTKKSIAFDYPPPGYSVKSDGKYKGRSPYPLVALAGDSLLEPFWPMGLGLKRGWHAVFDTCWAIDNMFNPDASKKITKKAEVSWDEHYECMREQIAKNLEYCKRLMISDDLAKGAYSEKSHVILQLRKKFKDAESPDFHVEIDPWTRYKELEKEFMDHAIYGLQGEEKDLWLHPQVQKEFGKIEFYAELRRKGKKDEFSHEGKKLITIEGREVEAAIKTVGGGSAAAPTAGGKAATFNRAAPLGGRKKRAPAATPAEKILHKPDVTEVMQKATEKRDSMTKQMMEAGLQGHGTKNPANVMGAKSAMPANIIAAMGLRGADGGHAAQADEMWEFSTGKHMTPMVEAELAHVRSMIDALTKSLEAYRMAEHQLKTEGKTNANIPM